MFIYCLHILKENDSRQGTMTMSNTLLKVKYPVCAHWLYSFLFV